MIPLEDWPAVNKALRLFLRHAEETLDQDTFVRLEALSDMPGSLVVVLRDTVELLYARREEIGAQGLILLGQLAQFAVEWDFYGFRSTGRGMQIMRVAGGDETDPPEAIAQYVRPAG